MPIDDILSSFLMKTNQCYLENTLEFTQKEILRSLCSDLEAVYCTVYLKEGDSYRMHSEYTATETTSAFFQLENLDLGNAPVYIPVQRSLYLPLLRGKKLYGFLLALWDKPSLFDQCTDRVVGLLLPLSLVLEKIYTEPPFIQSCMEKEEQLKELYLDIKQEFDHHLKVTSLTLHDDIDRMLLSVILQLEAIRGLDDLDLIKGRVAGLQHIAEQSLEKIQQVYTKINPHLLSRVGLKTALTAQVQEYTLSDMKVSLGIMGEIQELPSAVETMIYQTVQQVLANLQQQQYQGNVTVQLTGKHGRIFLQITGQDRKIMQNIIEQHLAGLHRQAVAACGKFWVNNLDFQGASLNLLLPMEPCWEVFRETANKSIHRR